MFRYLRDPLCLASWALYGANRWLLKPLAPAGEQFFRGHFNDLLLVPCALPPLLLLHRRLGWRDPASAPTAREVVFHLAVWSVVFELAAPRFVGRATADAWDVLAYWAGGVVAWGCWNRAAVFNFFSSRARLPRNLTGQAPTSTRMEQAMKTSARIFLPLLLLLVCVSSAAAQKRACPVPPPSPFKHNGRIVTSYDRATRGMRTTMTHPRLLGPSGAGYYLVASFAHQNPQRPTRLTMELVFVSAGKQPPGAGPISFVADGREFPLYGTSAQFQSVSDGQGASHQAARVSLPLDTVTNLLRARKVSARLGADSIELTHNHLEALRELASLLTPNYATVATH